MSRELGVNPAEGLLSCDDTAPGCQDEHLQPGAGLLSLTCYSSEHQSKEGLVACRASRRWTWSQPQGAWSPQDALSAAGDAGGGGSQSGRGPRRRSAIFYINALAAGRETAVQRGGHLPRATTRGREAGTMMRSLSQPCPFTSPPRGCTAAPPAPEDPPQGLRSLLLTPSLTSSSRGLGVVVPQPCEQALGAQRCLWLQSPHFLPCDSAALATSDITFISSQDTSKSRNQSAEWSVYRTHAGPKPHIPNRVRTHSQGEGGRASGHVGTGPADTEPRGR